MVFFTLCNDFILDEKKILIPNIKFPILHDFKKQIQYTSFFVFILNIIIYFFSSLGLVKNQSNPNNIEVIQIPKISKISIMIKFVQLFFVLNTVTYLFTSFFLFILKKDFPINLESLYSFILMLNIFYYLVSYFFFKTFHFIASFIFLFIQLHNFIIYIKVKDFLKYKSIFFQKKEIDDYFLTNGIVNKTSLLEC